MSKAKYGPEMTFSNKSLENSFHIMNDPTQTETPLGREFVNLIAKILESNFSKREDKNEIGEITWPERYWKGNLRHTVRVIYPDEWFFEFFVDPGVLEVNTSPMSIEEAREHKDRIQRDVFDIMPRVDLAPQLFLGAGHFHIDINAFENDPQLFRNYIVDYYNHPALTNGALNDDKFNSIGAADLPFKNREILKEVIKNFDENVLGKMDGFEAIQFLSKEIVEKAYNIESDDDPIYPFQDHKKRPEKYHALNLKNVYDSILSNKASTIEFRAIRPQHSAEDLVDIFELFEKRLEVIKNVEGLIPLDELQPFDIFVANFDDPKEVKRASDDSQKVLAQFYKYIKECDLDWDRYCKFVIPWWHAEDGDLERFNASL